MKRLLSLLLIISLALAFGCAGNKKIIEKIDPETGKVIERTTLDESDAVRKSADQIKHSKLQSEHSILDIKAAVNTTVRYVYKTDEKDNPVIDERTGEPIVLEKIVTTSTSPMEFKNVAYIRARVPMHPWQQVIGDWARIVKMVTGTLEKALPWGFSYGMVRALADVRGDNINIAGANERGVINIKGNQAVSQPSVSGGGEGSGNSASGSTATVTTSTSETKGDTNQGLFR